MNVCRKLCNECPFSKQSMKGFLADYSIEDFQNMMSQEVPFPCHKTMDEDDLDPYDVLGLVEQGDLKLCRGYIESMIKSCKSPKLNDEVIKAVELVKKQGVSPDSMSIFQFRAHHDIKNELDGKIL